jgi:hypothetical protein
MRIAFGTGGPAIVRAYPRPGEGSRVEEEQVLALLLNGPATPPASSSTPGANSPAWASACRCVS